MMRDEARFADEISYRKSEGVAWRRIGDEVVIVPVGESRMALDDGMYLLDEVAASMWMLIDGERTTAKIAARIAEEYDVDEARARRDLDTLLSRLADIGAVERRGA